MTSRRHFISTVALGAAGAALNTLPPPAVAATESAGSTFRKPEDDQDYWSSLDYGRIFVGGELQERAEQNAHRLQHPVYCVPNVFNSENAQSWPGDWVGRSLMGKVLLARSMGRIANEVSPFVAALPKQINKGGFLGPDWSPNALSEQQIGAHGWFIRGLCEYYFWTQESAARELLINVARNLGLRMRNAWESYPITGDARQRGEGGAIGNSKWQIGSWVLTTDVGTVFMLLDGLTQAWAVDRSAELRASIEAGIHRFLQMDQVNTQAQVHATLTTLRALLRMYAETGELRLLKAVEERYQLYRREAMTENYANYNYFDRPETWTEPCAIIDSFILAMQLWQFTESPEYLEDAHLIWFNAVGRSQRSTGGFGCDSCAGVDVPFLKMSIYEAYWCCTMRGGEGHSVAIQSAYHMRPQEFAVTFYTDSNADLSFTSGKLSLQQSTQYPYEGSVQLKVLSSSLRTSITARFFVPTWMASPRLELNGRSVETHTENGFLIARLTPRAGDILILNSALKTWISPTRNPNSISGYQVVHAGPLLLSYSGEGHVSLPDPDNLVAEAPGHFRVKGKNVTFGRLNDLHKAARPRWDPLEFAAASADKQRYVEEINLFDAHSSARQILFRDG